MQKLAKNIYVTQPSMPPLNEYIVYLEKIWQTRNITNNGPFHQELEKKLCDYLGVEYISLFTNGTIALVTALQVLKISGEVITTPFSFVATSHALLWNKIKPIFIDIESNTLNLDPHKIESAISESTSAIMPVHCYGNPCDIDNIQKIADKYNLKVIYDAAHAFSVKFNGKSILSYGDLSVVSFHATKVFNTFEGGAIICPDIDTKKRIDQLKNFGFIDELTVVEPGINGKMSELNAAFGLLQLKYIDKNIELRKRIDNLYRKKIKMIDGIQLIDKHQSSNYNYFPIIIQSKYPLTRDELYEKLKINGIYSRRYFYPLISSFPMYKKLLSANKENLKVAHNIAEKILCLPIYSDLTEDEANFIIDVITP